MDKKTLRSNIRAQKRAMTEQQIQSASETLTQLFLNTPQYQAAESIYGYLPYNQEVRTWDLLRRAQQDGKRVAVPKIYGDTMRFIWLDNLSQVKIGYCNIPEPIDDGPIANDPNALVLMPGLAFDEKGHRIGYGGGFYDKFLSAEPNHPTVALCYSFQLLPELQTEEFDIPVDTVLWA